MFSDYISIARQYYDEPGYEKDKSSLPYQANRYYSLINYLKTITNNIEYDYKDLYDEIKSSIFEKFNSSIKNGSINSELCELIEVRPPNRDFSHSYSNYSPSYSANRMYEKQRDKSEDDLDDISYGISNHLSYVMSYIVRKECYLNYKINETEDDIIKAEYKDKVLKLNRNIQQIGSNYMYGLHYTYVNDTYKKSTFNKEITHMDPIRYKPNIIVDKNWFDTVGDKGFQILEYQGSRAFTISAEEYSKDSNRTLYFVKTLQMTGTREEMRNANWHNVLDKLDKIVKIKELVLSVSNQDDKIWALGEDESWAERTMRARQKRTMMNGLNI